MRISDWSSDVCSSDLPATLSANLSALPSAARPSVQNCMNDAARQIGVTGGTRLSYDRLVNLEQGNGGWRIRAAMTATYPDGARSMEMYCRATRSEEHTSELQSLMRISYAVFCLKKKKKNNK